MQTSVTPHQFWDACRHARHAIVLEIFWTAGIPENDGNNMADERSFSCVLCSHCRNDICQQGTPFCFLCFSFCSLAFGPFEWTQFDIFYILPFLTCAVLIVRKVVNSNPGLKVDNFYCLKVLSIGYVCVVWEYSYAKLKRKKYTQNSMLKRCKNEIKILANSLIGLWTTRPRGLGGYS